MIIEYFFFNKNKSVNIAINKNKYFKQLYEVMISLSYLFASKVKKFRFKNIPLTTKNKTPTAILSNKFKQTEKKCCILYILYPLRKNY